MHALRLISFMMCSCLSVGFSLICGHVRKPLIGGFASSKAMSGKLSPSTTALAALLAVSLCSTSVCNLPLPYMCLELFMVSVF